MRDANKNIPAEVFCLADFLYEEMKARGWTSDDVAVRMGIRDDGGDFLLVALLLGVQRDSLVIDDKTFAGLARAFDISQEYFRNLHSTWLRWPDRRTPFRCPDDAFGPITRRGFVRPVSQGTP